MISAPDLACRLGLDRSARSWRGTCPSCSYPRAFSVRAGRVRPLLYCANGCDRQQLDHVAMRVAGGDWQPPERAEEQAVAAARQRKQQAAERLWRGSELAEGTLLDTYLTARGLPGLAQSAALRFRPDCHHPEGGRHPAMVALVQDATGQPIAVHRTYLRRDGSAKASAEPAKASLGPVWGGAIRLLDVNPAGALVVGEGIESSASAGRLMGLPAWAAISAGNLGRGLQLPPDIRDVVIAADPDAPGEAAACDAALRWSREGRRVRIARPDGDGDFNDVLLAHTNA